MQLSADGLAAGCGMYIMVADQLARYREAVADDRAGEELQAVVGSLRRRGIEIVGHGGLKTAPKSYPMGHPRIELLRPKGLVAWRQWPVAPWLGTAAAERRIVEFLRTARPLDEWLEAYVGQTELPPDR